MFTGYAQYKGRSIGRILHCLSVFCRNYHHLDRTQVGDGKVTLGSQTLATYTWPDEGDVPEFTFVGDGLSHDSDLPEYWTRCQQVLRPFVGLAQFQCGRFLCRERNLCGPMSPQQTYAHRSPLYPLG